MVERRHLWRLSSDALFVVAVILLFVLYQRVNQLKFTNGSYEYDGIEIKDVTLPINLVVAPPGEYRMKTTLGVGPLHANRFVINADNCLKGIEINGKVLKNEKFPFCEYNSSIVVDFGKYLHAGKNSVTFVITNNGGEAKLSVDPVKFDTGNAVLLAILLLLTLLYGLQGQRVSGWISLERFLLVVFLASRLWLFWQFYATGRGFDADKQIDMVSVAMGFNPYFDIFKTFYSYHPPLSFMVTQWVHSFGFSPESSISIITAASALGTFFFLRETLKRIGALFSFWGVFFLYLSSAIPLQVYLASSVNMDVLVLLFASIILYSSIHLFWPGKKKDDGEGKWMPFILVGALVGAFLTKFSGALLLSIPFLVLLVGQRRHWGEWKKALLLAAFAVAIVSPYYLLRFYRQSGTLFPSNAIVFDKEEIEANLKSRDEHPWLFIGKLLKVNRYTVFPKDSDIERLQNHDSSHPRLQDTWKDFWIADAYFLRQDHASLVASLWYMRIAPLLIFLGLLVLLFRRFRGRPEIPRWTFLLLLLFLIHIAALLSYVYKFPEAGWSKSTKAIYVAPGIWAVSMLFAIGAETAVSWIRHPRISQWAERILVFLLAVFVIVNHALPVY